MAFFLYQLFFSSSLHAKNVPLFIFESMCDMPAACLLMLSFIFFFDLQSLHEHQKNQKKPLEKHFKNSMVSFRSHLFCFFCGGSNSKHIHHFNKH